METCIEKFKIIKRHIFCHPEFISGSIKNQYFRFRNKCLRPKDVTGMAFFQRHQNQNFQKGQLLLEIIVVVGAVAIIGSIAAQLVYVSLQGGKFSSERNVAIGLADEAIEAANSVAAEKWFNIFNLNKGAGTSYYPQASSTGKWVLTQGTETIFLNNISYSRYVNIRNVCRDSGSTRYVTGITDSDGSTTDCALSGGAYDPSTQKITATIKWADNVEEISSSEYLTRWRNKICVQTSWSGSGSGTSTCPVSTYGSATNLITGDSLQISQ